MKKLIFIIILFFNLIPVLKKGEIRFSGPETAFADMFGGELDEVIVTPEQDEPDEPFVNPAPDFPDDHPEQIPGYPDDDFLAWMDEQTPSTPSDANEVTDVKPGKDYTEGELSKLLTKFGFTKVFRESTMVTAYRGSEFYQWVKEGNIWHQTTGPAFGNDGQPTNEPASIPENGWYIDMENQVVYYEGRTWQDWTAWQDWINSTNSTLMPDFNTILDNFEVPQGYDYWDDYWEDYYDDYNNDPQNPPGCPILKVKTSSTVSTTSVLAGTMNPDWCIKQPDPCDKVNNMVNGAANANYMQKVKDLATSQNLNLGYEKSVALIDGATPNIKEESGTTASASVQLPDLPSGQKYKSFTHTHSNVTGGTYTVFSFGDMQRMSMLLHSGQLDAKQFVAFLSTYKGTYYVLTITDKTKLEDFFYYVNNSGQASQGNIMKWFNSQQNGFNIQKKYFNDDKAPLITETDTNNNNVLDKFLDFMKEADLGVTLFETDANFDSFTKVEKDQNGTIQRTNCN